MKRLLPICCFMLCILLQARSQSVLYVAPGGSASNAGTSISAPTTLESAITKVTAGGTIYMRGGTYSYTATILIARTNSGTSSAYKNIVAYNNEVPLLSFTGQALSTSNRGIVLDGAYWHLTGLIIEGAGDNGLLLSGNNNIIEKCIFRKNRDSGLQLSRYNTAYTSISDWPSNNLILNCESYDNQDPDNEDADGFAAKLTCGTGNIFRGCVSHNNIDDGWDLYTKPDTGPIGAILLENCISHDNGILTTGGTSGNGDKNGFKLGGEDISVNHIVRRCIAFNNGKHGFTYNRNLGTIEVTNCTGYNNVERNFNFDGGTSVFKNNLSFQSGSNDRIIGTATAPNAFTGASSGFTITSADFQTLTPGTASAPTANGFLNLATGSDAINAGVATTGISYNGSAPDLGAIESGSTSTTNYTLSVAASPAAGGTITLSPSGGSYAAGTVVTLTATAASGYTFANWSGSASGASATTSVTMNSNLSVTANFTATGGGGTGSTIRIEDNATTTTGLCSYDGSLSANTGANNGYVINLTNSSAKGITWRVNAAAAGSYTLTWRYKNSGSQAATSAKLLVNGATINSVLAFPKTSSSTTFTTTTATVSLVSGGNTIRVETTQATEFADIDWIEITGNSPTAGNCTGARVAAPVDTRETTPITFTKAGVYPNPTTGKVIIAFTLPSSQKVSVRVYNALGQVVDAIGERSFAAGNNQLEYNGMTGRRPGNYFIVLAGSNGSSELFTLMKK
ncbi:MAG: T9SS type A sorting domain-containing protein [Chitinophagaceae bacterium]